MDKELDHRRIGNGYTWEAMMQVLLSFSDPETKLFSRPGKDWSMDALSGDGLTVYQAKYHESPSIGKTISDAKVELEKIKGYRTQKTYWKSVSNWYLFTNLEINVQDEKRWQDEVVPLFTAQNISATLFDWGRVRSLLVNYPAVIGPFFRDEPRIFFTFPDEVRRQTEESWFSPALDVPCEGRISELSQFDEFLKSGKKIWSVSGAGGMGKSRFLLECAKKVGGDWVAYWSTSDQLSHPSLYNGIVPEKQIILFVDELENTTALQLLIRELQIGRMKQWKIVFTEKVSDSPTIKFLSEAKYSQIYFPHCSLGRLNNPQAETLLANLIRGLPFTLNDTIENVAAKLRHLCGGVPLWAGLCVKLISEKGGLHDLPDQAEKLLEKYLDWFLKSAESESIDRPRAISLLNWIALFGKAEIENPDVLTFLAAKTGLSKKEVIKTCKLLVSKGIAFRLGSNKRYLKIIPDSIKDKILLDAIIDVNSLTAFGEGCISILLQEEVPHRDQILENMALIEYVLDSQSGKRVEITKRLIEHIEHRANIGSTTEQLTILELIDKFAFANPLMAIKVLKACWDNDRGDITQEGSVWGPRTFTHKEVKSKIPWSLFKVSQHAESQEEQDAAFNYFLQIMEDEIATGEPISGTAESVQQLFVRVLFGEFWSPSYKELIKTRTDNYFGRLSNNENLSTLDEIVFHHLISGLTKSERTFMGPTYDYRVTFNRQNILPGMHPWGDIENYYEKIKQLLLKPDLRVEMKQELAKVYADVIPSVNRGLLPGKTGDSSPYLQKTNEFFIKEFTWIKEYLLQTKVEVPLAIRDILREAWHWHLEFSEDVAIKKAAEDCENTYFLDEEHKAFGALLGERYPSQEEHNKQISDAISRWIDGKSAADVSRFLDAAAKFDPKGKYSHKIREIGYVFGQKLVSEDIFDEFCTAFLPSQLDSTPWLFITGLLKTYLHKKAGENPSKAIGKLRANLILLTEKGNSKHVEAILSDFYWRPWWAGRRLVRDDLDIVLENTISFENDYKKWSLLASLSFCFWEEITLHVDSLWDQISLNEKQIFLREFIESGMFMKQIVENSGFAWSESHSNWLVDKIATLEDTRSLENQRYYLDHNFPVKGCKGIVWLRETISKRRAEMDDSKVLPHFFRLSYFSKGDFAKAEELQAFDELIEMCTEDSLTGYYLPPYLKDLDPGMQQLGRIVSQKISASSDFNRVFKLARIAGEFHRNEKIWDEISLATCNYAQGKEEKERFRLYGALDWKGVRSYSRAMGTVADTYHKERDELLDGMKQEIHDIRREYWQKELEWAETELRKAEEEAREERGE
jgi:hypothetical protein